MEEWLEKIKKKMKKYGIPIKMKKFDADYKMKIVFLKAKNSLKMKIWL